MRGFRTATFVAVFSSPLVLAGCGAAIRGDWHLVRAVPNADVFAVDDATFNGDGTFEATLTIDGRTDRVTGTYGFNGWKLALHPDAGGLRTFNASVGLRTLNIIHEERDRKRRAILEKGAR
jgi:hypothetical protein